MKNSQKIDFAVGGQAVLEGVMMRSPHFYTVSVRDPEGGIQMDQKPFVSVLDRIKWLKLPLVRGVVHLIESMRIGFRALDFSSLVAFPEEGEKKDLSTTKKSGLQTILGVVSILFSIALTLFLLKALPLWTAQQAASWWPVVNEQSVLFNAIDGVMKLLIFVSYILLISLLKDIYRVFQYHGAEHKSIWAYEKGLDLTVESARAQTRFHPRCGTSFIFLVILMSIVVYTFLPRSESFAIMLASRIAVIPLIAGLGYEILKLSAKWQDHFLVKLLVLPGLLFQRLTTKEPTDDQLEIAIHSLKASLNAESTYVP